MKRTPIARKTPLHRVGFKAHSTPMPRATRVHAATNSEQPNKARRGKRLAPFSAKTIAQRPARQACVQAVKERDQVCQFPLYLEAFIARGGAEPGVAIPTCSPDLTAHEPAHRRNVDITDARNCIALCSAHNSWIEAHSVLGYATGLLVRGNGLPLRKGIAS